MGDAHNTQNETYRMVEMTNGGRDAHVKGGGNIEHENQDQVAGAEAALIGNGNLQIESQSSRGCKRLALILSLTALLTCLAVLLYVTGVLATQFIPRDRDKHAMTSSEDRTSFQEVCLDCQRLVKNPYTQHRNDPVVEGLTQRKEGHVLACCAENPVQMSAMLKAVARRQDTIKDVFPAAFKDMQKSSAVFVHKQMISETWNSLTGYSVMKFDPSNNQGLGEQNRGATVLEDGIVILKTGTYYIYSNVFFSVNETGKASSNQVEFSHYSQGISFKYFSVMSAWYILTESPLISAWSCLTNYSCKVAGLPGRVLAAFSVSPNTLLVDVSTRELEAVRVTPVTYESMKPVAQKAMANY